MTVDDMLLRAPSEEQLAGWRRELVCSFLPDSRVWFRSGLPFEQVMLLYPMTTDVLQERMIFALVKPGGRTQREAYRLMTRADEAWQRQGLNREHLQSLTAGQGVVSVGQHLVNRAIWAEGNVLTRGQAYSGIAQSIQFFALWLTRPDFPLDFWTFHGEQLLSGEILRRALAFWLELLAYISVEGDTHD